MRFIIAIWERGNSQMYIKSEHRIYDLTGKFIYIKPTPKNRFDQNSETEYQLVCGYKYDEWVIINRYETKEAAEKVVEQIALSIATGMKIIDIT